MPEPLSIQLYTLRDQMAADRDGTLTRLAEIGYRSVEPYDPTADPAGFREIADDLGLTVPSTHAYALFSKDAGEVFEAVRTVGTDRSIIPGGIDHDLFTTLDGLRQVADHVGGRPRVRLMSADSRGLGIAGRPRLISEPPARCASTERVLSNLGLPH